jgi:hypothetical protein
MMLRCRTFASAVISATVFSLLSTISSTFENQQLRQQPPMLPHDPRLPHHEFEPKLISMCVNLGAKVGLRAGVTCLKIVFKWLNVDEKLPAKIGNPLVEFVRQSEEKPAEGQRLPMSTEIPESSCGLFRQLERRADAQWQSL